MYLKVAVVILGWMECLLDVLEDVEEGVCQCAKSGKCLGVIENIVIFLCDVRIGCGGLRGIATGFLGFQHACESKPSWRRNMSN